MAYFGGHEAGGCKEPSCRPLGVPLGASWTPCKNNEKPNVFEGVEAKIGDSCTDFNDFLSRGASRRAETFFDDSYTVFTDFSLARQGA